MPYPSSNSAQAAYAIEAVAGTRQTPTIFVEIASETLKRNPQFLRPRPVAGGRLMPKRKVLAGQKPGGGISFPVYPETIGPLLRATLGKVATTGAGPYTHVITPDQANVRPAMTWQFGRPDAAAGTVHAFDYIGCYVEQLELACNAGEEVMASVDLVGMREVDDQTLAVATFPTVTPLTFLHATLTASGGTECFDSITVTLKNSNAARQQACPTNPGEQKVTPLGVDVYGGTVTRDWRNQDLYDEMVLGTEGTLSLAFNAGASAQLTLAGNVFFANAGSNVPGSNALLKETVPFEFVSGTSDAAAFTATLITTVATL